MTATLGVGGTQTIAELSGADGIATFPAGAAAADAVSLAEVLRFLQEAVRQGSGAAMPANQSLYDMLAGATGIAAFPAGAAPANDVSIAEALRWAAEAVRSGTGTATPANTSLYDILAGANGVPVYPAAAEAGNGVSLAEAVRWISACVRTGAGTALAADRSLVDALGTDGTTPIDGAASVLGAIGIDDANNVFASTNVTANEDGSVLERLEQIQEAVNVGTGTALGANRSLLDELRGAALNNSNAGYLRVSVDLTIAAWNSAASHEVFTVTGLVRMRMIAQITETLADAADLATIAFGHEASAAAYIAATDAAGLNGNTLSAGEIWIDATPADQEAAFSAAILDRVVNGLDIGYTIGGEALTDGTIDFLCWWEALSSDGAVVAGAGGVL